MSYAKLCSPFIPFIDINFLPVSLSAALVLVLAAPFHSTYLLARPPMDRSDRSLYHHLYMIADPPINPDSLQPLSAQSSIFTLKSPSPRSSFVPDLLPLFLYFCSSM
ncbi:hypothetical protein AcW1_009425 [Taiwanofungus camphoratus]|nr:hypothetical protein AcV5_003496 [Antrodia cinnamomea]KAI0934973.1 hypothetical protein AcV7_003896 [Antrodia cinnamomea]KAI0947742.1 hypothetical protein AcW1_009425 [Antrodia cinnamomea]